MQLLYCNASGMVVATHEDTVVAVPKSAYSTVVRIIPYDAPLSTLERVGDPPPQIGRPPMSDPRPYKQPDPTPAILKGYAAQVRYDRIVEGFHFAAVSGDIPVWTDRQSYMLCNGLATWAATVPASTAVSFTQGNDVYPITAAEGIALFNQFTLLVQDCRKIEGDCVADLNSPAPTLLTYDDVDARFSSGVTSRKAERPLSRMI